MKFYRIEEKDFWLGDRVTIKREPALLRQIHNSFDDQTDPDVVDLISHITLERPFRVSLIIKDDLGNQMFVLKNWHNEKVQLAFTRSELKPYIETHRAR